MTKTKELSNNNPYLNSNLIDFLRFIDPSEKSKYVDLTYRLFIKTRMDKEVSGYNSREFRNTFKEFGINEKVIENIDAETLVMYYQFFSLFIDRSDYKLLIELCELHDRKLTNIDLSQIKSINELRNIVTLNSIKKYLKDTEKSINIIHRDDKWLLLKPLSHQSSLKYGKSTKWCTASNDPYHFRRYSQNGILIYIVNLETGNKYGFFHSLYSDPETSFWNVIDQRVDSMQTEIDGYVLDIIRNEMKNNPRSNWEYISDEEKKLLDEKSGDTVMQEPALLNVEIGYDTPIINDEIRIYEDLPTALDNPTIVSSFVSDSNGVMNIEFQS